MSLLVLIFGFGVMNLFWSMLPAYNNLPGLYYYRAATWGDGFLLPLLVGSATYYILSGSALTIKQKNRSYIMGGIAALIGILLQGSWLLNSNINLNWTIPMPHYFNIAGWYHSIFFIGIFFVISMLMTQVWYIRKNNCKGNKELYEILPYVLIWFAGSGFLFILALDDYSSVFHYMSLLLVLASVIVIGGLVFSATSIKEINLMDIACILSGIFTSLGIVIISVENINGNIWHPIATALLSITYIIQHKKILVVVIQCVLIAIPTFSINMAIVVFGLDSSIYLITLIIIAIIVPLIIAIAQKETLEQDFERGIFNKHITTGIICTTAQLHLTTSSVT